MNHPYKALIFDVDDTLLRYEQAERNVLRGLFAREGRALTPAQSEYLWRVSDDRWNALGLNHPDTEAVQNGYHALFRRYLTGFLAQVRAEFGLSAPVEALAEGFLSLLAQQFDPYPDTEPVLRTLADRYPLFVATNGLSAVQGARVAPLKQYFRRIFISEDIGVCKPSPRFFRTILREIGVSPERCLMIGDSLTMDVWGAQAVGMSSCWVHPGAPAAPNPPPMLQIASLSELLTFL